MKHRIQKYLSTATILLAGLLWIAPGLVHAQVTISGTVTDVDGEALPGANVVLQHTTAGVSTDAEGSYAMNGVEPGSYSIVASFVGYEAQRRRITVRSGDLTVDFSLAVSNQMLDDIMVFASRAIDRITPVAYSDVEKQEIQNRLGSRDIPLLMNTKPGVYATAQGGGKGDARITVRGFSQRNTAVMINGVPVNDMENGWVYWSNWDAVGDVTASMQLQRGLSAINLAVPSIGGTLNIITDPADMEPGVNVKQEAGRGAFRKTTVAASTGRIDDTFALTVQGTRTTGDGVVDGTWIDAWSYYVAASYDIDARNRLALYAVGAPQRHGQFLYQNNIGAFDAGFARSLDDYDSAALEQYPEAQAGRFYNQNWAPVSADYAGKQAVEDHRFDRHRSNFLNERENFYHKPQVNLNWYSQLTGRLNLSTVVYYSGGEGGGSGTLGSMVWNNSGPSRRVDWNGTIAQNQDTVDTNGERVALGALRNSRNNQWTLGAISKLNVELGDELTAEVGLDWRTAEIEHYQEIRDLLGGDYFYSTTSDFWTTDAQRKRRLGEKAAYDFTNDVDWIGAYAQSEYVTDRFSTYGMAGLSAIKYQHTNHFIEEDGDALYVESDRLLGYQLKGGGLYNFAEPFDLFANIGYISKVPIFDEVISDGNGALNEDPKNETFIAFETGINVRVPTHGLATKLNVYSTWRRDRAITRSIRNAAGEDALVNLTGVNQWHRGVELELAYQPVDLIRFDGGLALNNWEFTDDASGRYLEDVSSQEYQEFDYYIDDLKVGNAPQTQLSYALSLYPLDALDLQLVGNTYADHYADFDPTGRTDPNDRAQSWKAPGYTTFDAHVSYELPLRSAEVGVRIEGHVFNLFDAVYVQDATDNDSFNGFDFDHDADDAAVFLGLPRTFNIGLTLTY